MFQDEQLRRCQERKAALIGRNVGYRRALTRDALSLREVAVWVDLGAIAATKLREGWIALAPMRSFWQTQESAKPGFAKRMAAAMSIARSLMALWNNWH